MHVAHVWVSEVPVPAQLEPFLKLPAAHAYVAPPLAHSAHVCVSTVPAPEHAAPLMKLPVVHA